MGAPPVEVAPVAWRVGWSPTVWYPILMLTVRARVKGGRLYVDDPVDLPEDA